MPVARPFLVKKVNFVRLTIDTLSKKKIVGCLTEETTYSPLEIMAEFTVRIELHDANDKYEALHEAMKRDGFSRTIVSNEGTEQHLPPDEYYFIGDKSPSQVLSSAKPAMGATRLKGAVLVTEANGWLWIGLEEVED